MLYAAYGTFSVPELAELTEPGLLLIVAGGLIAVAGLAKSAQVPFQFWLPRAMAAPTPVSAYLHSAAMVAAGVLLIGRVYPLLQKSEFLLGALTVIGAGSILVGGLIGAVPRRSEATARVLHDLPVRVRDLYVRDGRQVRRDGSLLLRDSPTPSQRAPCS